MATDLATRVRERRAPPDNVDALYEVVNGIRIELPPMSTWSNLIASRIYLRMAPAASEQRLGTACMENLFVLDPETDLRRRPDVAFVSAERWSLDREVPESGDWEVVPDLCVEVTSPNDLYDEVMGKVQEYFRHGVRQVWIVWPAERQVHVYGSPRDVLVLAGEDTLRSDELLPGFVVRLDALFRREAGAAL